MDATSDTAARFASIATYIPVVLMILVLVALVAYYFWPRDDTVLAMGPFKLHGSSTVLYPSIQLFDMAQTQKGFANNFTFGTYIYVSDDTKPLMVGQQPPNLLIKLQGAGIIAIDTQHETAQIQLDPMNPPGVTNPSSIVTVPNFMASRWNQLLFSIEGRTVDVYLNGALASSTLLDNVPQATPMEITLNVQPGFDGQLGYAQAWPRRLTMSEVLANYKRTSDRKGKPYIPDTPFKWSDLTKYLERGFCYIGMCADGQKPQGPLQFINYEF